MPAQQAGIFIFWFIIASLFETGEIIYAQNSSSTSPYTTYLERYSISAGTWEARTGSLYPRRYAGMACIGENIYMIGGLRPYNSSPKICQRYNTLSDSWSTIAEIPDDSLTFTKWSVTTDGNYIFLVGSGGGYNPWPLNSNCWYYTPGTDTWALESVLPAPRGLALGFFVNGFYELFFGGGNDGSSGSAYQDDVWEGTGGIYIPVELISFNGYRISEGVELTWLTATETNNSHFIVERSLDKTSYIEVANIIGHGTTTMQSTYTYLDKNVAGTKLYYRLKQVDYDGTFKYSGIIEVDGSKPLSFNLNQNYPNPFNPSTRIDYSINEKNPVTLKIYDILGNEVSVLVNEFKESGIYTVEFNGSSLSSGVYIYKLQSGSHTAVKTMIMTK